MSKILYAIGATRGPRTPAWVFLLKFLAAPLYRIVSILSNFFRGNFTETILQHENKKVTENANVI